MGWWFATQSSGKRNMQLAQQGLWRRMIRLTSLDIEIGSECAAASFVGFRHLRAAISTGGK